MNTSTQPFVKTNKFKILATIEVALICLAIFTMKDATINWNYVHTLEKPEYAEYPQLASNLETAYTLCSKLTYELTGRIAPEVGSIEYKRIVSKASIYPEYTKDVDHGFDLLLTFNNILNDAYGPLHFDGVSGKQAEKRITDPDFPGHPKRYTYIAEVSCSYHSSKKGLHGFSVELREPSFVKDSQHFSFIHKHVRKKNWESMKQILSRELAKDKYI